MAARMSLAFRTVNVQEGSPNVCNLNASFPKRVKVGDVAFIGGNDYVVAQLLPSNDFVLHKPYKGATSKRGIQCVFYWAFKKNCVAL